MDIRLYLNETLVDLPADIGRQLRLSKYGTEASDLESSRGDHSYSFTLPDTRTNNGVFRNAVEHVKSRKFFSLVAGTARLEAGGEVLLTGGFRLKGIQAGYSVQLVSGEVDLFGLLAEKTLRDLAFAPWAYKGQDDFADMLSAPIGAGTVCWPLVAYGNFFSGDTLAGVEVTSLSDIVQPIEQDDYTPSVYFTAILRQIFADQGWQAVGEPLTDPVWKKRCLPHTGEEYKWNWRELLRLEAASASINAGQWLRSNPDPEQDGKVSRFRVLEPVASYNPVRRYRSRSVRMNQVQWAYELYQVRRAGVYQVQLTVNVQALDMTSSGASEFSLQLLRVPVGGWFNDGEVLAEEPLSEGNSGLRTLSLPLAFLEETDLLIPVVRLRTDPALTPVVSMVLAEVAFTVTPTEEVGPLEISIQENLPEISQRDFVKAFCVMAGLRFSLDMTRRVITFFYRERYELGADFAVDLTGLADPQENEYLPAIGARTFTFAFAGDSADALRPAGYGDKVIDTGNANAEGEQRLELPFAPTATRAFQARDANGLARAFTLPCMASREQLDTPLNEVAWDFGYTPRLIDYEGPSELPDALPLAFRGDFFDRFPYGRASVAGNTWEELFTAYYGGYFLGMAKGHITKNTFALSPGLYRRLTPARPVLFDGVLYRLGRVSGFQPGSLATAEVELLYIEEAAYGGGRPAEDNSQQGKEFYSGEFYQKEWY